MFVCVSVCAEVRSFQEPVLFNPQSSSGMNFKACYAPACTSWHRAGSSAATGHREVPRSVYKCGPDKSSVSFVMLKRPVKLQCLQSLF